MLSMETELYKQGYNFIACIDEAGRGCLAGDVVAAAVIMPKGLVIPGVKDSKKLSEKKREELYNIILEKSIAIGIGRVDPRTIDKINIKESTRVAMKLAVDNLRDREGNPVKADYLLIDAEEINSNIPQEGIIQGDNKSHGISCASIIAKVYRDRLCVDWDKEYEGYNIKKHKGYGTKEHRQAIKDKGYTSIHRVTFLKNILKG